jgi:hypothetical protein
MKSIKFLALFILISNQLIFSQTTNYQSDEWLISPFWDFYSDNRLSTVASGKGYTGLASVNDISGILINPATFNSDTKYHAHISTIFKSKVQWLPEITTGIYLKEVFPTVFAGFGYKISKYFQTGFVYHNSNSHLLDLGEIIQTDEFGNVIGKFEAYERFNTHSFTIPLIANLTNFRMGVNLTYSYFTGFKNFSEGLVSSTGVQEGKARFGKFIPQFGFQFTPVKYFSFGSSYTPEFTQTVVWNWSNGSTETSNPQKYPTRFSSGVEFRLKYFNIDFDYNFTHSSVDYRLKNRHDIHFGMEYPIDKKWMVRMGFFTLKDYRNENMNSIIPPESLSQFFLTLGATMKFKNGVINIALMDSHLSSTGTVKTTLVNAGLSLNY